MKNRFSIPTLWLLSAAGTFALGWAVKPQPAPLESDPSGSLRQPYRSGPTAAVARNSKRAQTQAGADAGGSGAFLGHIGKYVTDGSISPENMAAAIHDMRRENDPLKKRAMFSQLLEQMTPENAKSAFLALREGGNGGDRRFGRGGGGGDEERLLLNAWGRIDGAGAIAELTAMNEERRAKREAERAARGEGAEPGQGGGQGRGRGGPGGDSEGGGFDLSSVLSGWATADATSAMSYVNGVEDERMKGMLTGSVIRGLMVNGVDGAVSFIGSLPADDENRGRHMWTVAEEVLEDGVANAAQWVGNLADDSLKEGAMRRIAESYSRENLQDAIAWVGDHQGEEYARSAVTQVAERWAESDPQAVIEWAGKLPEDTQRSVFTEAFDEWTERDALGASQYLAEMPASPIRDSAVQGFATELSREDPDSAVQWASTISEPELRAETLARVARDWVRSDKAAALAWLPTSGLSAVQQQQVAESANRGGDSRGGRGFGGRGR